MDDQNRSKGCGTVTFETHDEAQKAIGIFSNKTKKNSRASMRRRGIKTTLDSHIEFHFYFR